MKFWFVILHRLETVERLYVNRTPVFRIPVYNVLNVPFQSKFEACCFMLIKQALNCSLQNTVFFLREIISCGLDFD